MAEISRSVLKALEMIELLAPAQHGLSLSEVAERTSFPMSAAHRLSATLAGQSYVAQDPQTRRYCLGSKLFALQAQFAPRRHLARIAPPYLRRLMRQLNAAVNLGVLVGQEAVYIETVSPDSIFSLRAPPGTRIPLHCTAGGKMLFGASSPGGSRDYPHLSEAGTVHGAYHHLTRRLEGGTAAGCTKGIRGGQPGVCCGRSPHCSSRP